MPKPVNGDGDAQRAARFEVLYVVLDILRWAFGEFWYRDISHESASAPRTAAGSTDLQLLMLVMLGLIRERMTERNARGISGRNTGQELGFEDIAGHWLAE